MYDSALLCAIIQAWNKQNMNPGPLAHKVKRIHITQRACESSETSHPSQFHIENAPLMARRTDVSLILTEKSQIMHQ